MRTGNKEAKETTRRLIKAGLAVGILGGGAATAQMDAFAAETKATPVDDFYEVVGEENGKGKIEGGFEKVDSEATKNASEAVSEVESTLNVKYEDLESEYETTDDKEGNKQKTIDSMSTSAAESDALSEKIASEQFSEATSAYKAADEYLTGSESNLAKEIKKSTEDLSAAEEVAEEAAKALGEEGDKDLDGDGTVYGKSETASGAYKDLKDAQDDLVAKEKTLGPEVKDEEGKVVKEASGSTKALADANKKVEDAEITLGVEGVDTDNDGISDTATGAYKALADAQREKAAKDAELTKAENALKTALSADAAKDTTAPYSSTIQDYDKNGTNASAGATAKAEELVKALKSDKETAEAFVEAIKVAFKDDASKQTEFINLVNTIVTNIGNDYTTALNDQKSIDELAGVYNTLLENRAEEIYAFNHNTGDLAQKDATLAKNIIEYNLAKNNVAAVVDVTNQTAEVKTNDENVEQHQIVTVTTTDEAGNKVTTSYTYSVDPEKHNRGKVQDSSHWLTINEVGEEDVYESQVDYYVGGLSHSRYTVEEYNRANSIVKAFLNPVYKNVKVGTKAVAGNKVAGYDEDEIVYSQTVNVPGRYDLAGIQAKITAYNTAKTEASNAASKVAKKEQELKDAKKALSDAETEQGIAKTNYDTAKKDYDDAVKAVEDAEEALTQAKQDKNDADDKVRELDEKLNGTGKYIAGPNSTVYQDGGLVSEAGSLTALHSDVNARWREYNATSTLRSESAEGSVTASESVYNNIKINAYSETPAASSASNDDNDSSVSEEVAVQEEAGSVLGADRALDNNETAVATEEGGSVLGAERGRSPKTNDAANVLGAVATMGSSLAGAGAVLGLRRRNK